VLELDHGAIGCNLSRFKLGFCLLRKSNGSGLYATKDLALARRKFDMFRIDRSIYVVDASQTLHFQQVFKVLELMGYEKARKCVHLPYGQVILSTGKMSSRLGNVILFSALRRMLHEQIGADFLNKYRGDWKEEEINDASHAIAVATIRFGMLNHDLPKDIVFELAEWAAKGGMTGPYLLYAYARTRSIVREVQRHPSAKVDLRLLTRTTERVVLSQMHNFWPLLHSALAKHSPSSLCEYLFDLAKGYNAWYEQVSIKDEPDINVQATRLVFLDAFARLLRAGLAVLGIRTIERM